MKVSAVVITRDDSRTIERALRSARSYVDELVVVDLGSVDDTVARARRCGASVHSASWGVDTAAVRNAALDHSDADWNVVIEAGEWIEAGGAALAALRETPAERAGVVEVRPGEAARGLAQPSLEVRILPRGIRFVGRHRATAAIDGSESWRSELVLGRDDGDAAPWRYDRSAAEAVILQSLALHADEPGLLTELAEILRNVGRLEEACDVFTATLNLLGDGPERPLTLVIDALDTFREGRRFREAIALMDAEMPHRQDSPDFSYVVGDLFFEMLLDQPDTAEQLAPLAVASWQRCLEIGDRPELPGTVNGRGSFLAAQNLATLHLALGIDEQADYWWAEADRLRDLASTRHAA